MSGTTAVDGAALAAQTLDSLTRAISYRAFKGLSHTRVGECTVAVRCSPDSAAADSNTVSNGATGSIASIPKDDVASLYVARGLKDFYPRCSRNEVDLVLPFETAVDKLNRRLHRAICDTYAHYPDIKFNPSHIYASVVQAYRQACGGDVSTTFMLQGETGSGKTTALHEIMQAMQAIAPSTYTLSCIPYDNVIKTCAAVGSTVCAMLRHAVVVLECFSSSPNTLASNISTTATTATATSSTGEYNASKAVILVRYAVSKVGVVVSADIRGLLVDRWRTSMRHIASGTHIFNTLLSLAFGCTDRAIGDACYLPLLHEVWGEEVADVYRMRQDAAGVGRCRASFLQLQHAFASIGFDYSAQIHIFRMLAAVMLLNELPAIAQQPLGGEERSGASNSGKSDDNSDNKSENCDIIESSGNEELANRVFIALSDLLELPLAQLRAVLLSRAMATGLAGPKGRGRLSKTGPSSPQVSTPLTCEVFACSLYSRLFDHVVEHANAAIGEARDVALARAKGACGELAAGKLKSGQALRLCELALTPVAYINVMDAPGLAVGNAVEAGAALDTSASKADAATAVDALAGLVSSMPQRISMRSRFRREAMKLDPLRPYIYEGGELLCSYVAERLREAAYVNAIDEPLSRLEANGVDHPTLSSAYWSSNAEIFSPGNAASKIRPPPTQAVTQLFDGGFGIPTCLFSIFTEMSSLVFNPLPSSSCTMSTLFDSVPIVEAKCVHNVDGLLARTKRVCVAAASDGYERPLLGISHSHSDVLYSPRGLLYLFAFNDCCILCQFGSAADATLASCGGIPLPVYRLVEARTTFSLLRTLVTTPIRSDVADLHHACSPNLGACLQAGFADMLARAYSAPPCSPFFSPPAPSIHRTHAVICASVDVNGADFSKASYEMPGAGSRDLARQLLTQGVVHHFHMSAWSFPFIMEQAQFLERYKALSPMALADDRPTLEKVYRMLNALCKRAGVSGNWYHSSNAVLMPGRRCGAKASSNQLESGSLADALVSASHVMLNRQFEENLEALLEDAMRITAHAFKQLSNALSTLYWRSRFRVLRRQATFTQKLVRGFLIRKHWGKVLVAWRLLRRWMSSRVCRERFMLCRALQMANARLWMRRKCLKQYPHLKLMFREDLPSVHVLRSYMSSLPRVKRFVERWTRRYRRLKRDGRAVTKIQAIWRGTTCRRRHLDDIRELISRIVRLHESRASVCIQAAVRSFIARRKYLLLKRVAAMLTHLWMRKQLIRKLQLFAKAVRVLRRVIGQWTVYYRLRRIRAEVAMTRAAAVIADLLKPEAERIINGSPQWLRFCSDSTISSLHSLVTTIAVRPAWDGARDLNDLQRCPLDLDYYMDPTTSYYRVIDSINEVSSVNQCSACFELSLRDVLDHKFIDRIAGGVAGTVAALMEKLGNDSSTTHHPSCHRGILCLAYGRSHQLAIGADKQLYCWGDNVHGQCGAGPVTREVAKPTCMLPGIQIAYAAATARQSLAVSMHGDLYVSGNGANRKSSTFELMKGRMNVLAMSAGWHHVSLLHATGDVTQWNEFSDHPSSRVEFGATSSVGLPPSKWLLETTMKLAPHVSSRVRVVQLSCGGLHTVALDDANSMWAWGRNRYGQCGESNSVAIEQVGATLLCPSKDPVMLHFAMESTGCDMKGYEITSIAAGGHASYALLRFHRPGALGMDTVYAVMQWGKFGTSMYYNYPALPGNAPLLRRHSGNARLLAHFADPAAFRIVDHDAPGPKRATTPRGKPQRTMTTTSSPQMQPPTKWSTPSPAVRAVGTVEVGSPKRRLPRKPRIFAIHSAHYNVLMLEC